MAKMTTQFCIECRKETEYKIQKEHLLHEIKGKSYDFEILVARCKECHEKVNLPGLMDINSKLIDEQYRQFENLVSIEDYWRLMITWIGANRWSSWTTTPRKGVWLLLNGSPDYS